MAEIAPKYVIDLAPKDSDGRRLVDTAGNPLFPTSNYQNLEPHEIAQRQKDERDLGQGRQQRQAAQQARLDARNRIRERAKTDPTFADIALALGLNVDTSPGE